MNKTPLVSVVIRAYNEARTLETLLKKLREQTLQDFKIVLVDNESTDNTREIAEKYSVDTIITITKQEFSHPRSTNVGIEAAKAPLVVLTNGHCEPMSTTWLEDGIKNFVDPLVAGIAGHYIAGVEGTVWQQQNDKDYQEARNQRIEDEYISTTNAIIRKDLWDTYRFDESLPECEDYDWSLEMKSRGLKIIKDPHFNVIHNHPLTEEQWDARVEVWAKLCDLIDQRERPYKK